jgi:hypothetical protein
MSIAHNVAAAGILRVAEECEKKVAACERQVNELAEIRDVLLAALNGIVNFHNENCEDEELYPEFLEHLNICKAAIAKASQ